MLGLPYYDKKKLHTKHKQKRIRKNPTKNTQIELYALLQTFQISTLFK